MNTAVIFAVGAMLFGCTSAKWEPPSAGVEKAFAACKAEGRAAEGLSVESFGYGYRIRGGPAGRDELEACMRDKLR
jgi:hypothetical protein